MPINSTSSIYELKASVQMLSIRLDSLETNLKDHENRLRLLEKWHYLVLGAITLFNFPGVREGIVYLFKHP